MSPSEKHEGAVEPALTSEEWRHYLSTKASGRDFDLVEISWGECVDGHTAAALCLHDHPAGFTWADVDALMESPPDEPKLTKIAARIASLLPPREP